MNKQPPIMDVPSMDQDIRKQSPEAELLRLYGSHSLAFFGFTPKNRHFLTPVDSLGSSHRGAGLVNYQLTHKVAVVLGDPLCAPAVHEQITQSFLDFCARQHWSVAFYQASSEHLTAYRALHLHTFKMGEEAILYPQTFTLQSPALANVRTSCRRAEREGIHIRWYEGVPPQEVVQQLADLSKVWLAHKAGKQTEERGFSMGKVDELSESARRAEMIATIPIPATGVPPASPHLVTAVAETSMGQPCAFVTFTPIYGHLASEATVPGEASTMQGWGWALDLMRRVPDAPPGVMELLLVRTIERFRASGAHKVSLGLVAMADSRQEVSGFKQTLVNFVAKRLGLKSASRSLFAFKQKFDPSWEGRYLIANTTLGLPNVVRAVLQLRNAGEGGRKKLFKQWIRYCLVGVTNTLLDITTLSVLLWCFPTTHVQILVAYNSLAYVAGAVNSFVLNKYWTFKHKQGATSQEMRRYVVSLLLEILTSNGLVWLIGTVLQPFFVKAIVWGTASKLLALAGNAVLSYLLMRFWIFQRK